MWKHQIDLTWNIFQIHPAEFSNELDPLFSQLCQGSYFRMSHFGLFESLFLSSIQIQCKLPRDTLSSWVTSVYAGAFLPLHSGFCQFSTLNSFLCPPQYPLVSPHPTPHISCTQLLQFGSNPGSVYSINTLCASINKDSQKLPAEVHSVTCLLLETELPLPRSIKVICYKQPLHLRQTSREAVTLSCTVEVQVGNYPLLISPFPQVTQHHFSCGLHIPVQHLNLLNVFQVVFTLYL